MKKQSVEEEIWRLIERIAEITKEKNIPCCRDGTGKG